MRKTLLASCLMLSCALTANAQRELLNPLIDSREVIQKGVALHDEGKYKEALAQYLKVPRSDTNYADVLHEIILSYYNDSNYVQAERYVDTARSMFPDKSPDWLNLLANIYDDSKRTDLALKAYDSIIAQNPYSYIAYFNKGITLMRQTKYDDAEANLQKCIMLHPFYSSAHYFLGQIELLKGNLVQAMMSLATNLMVDPQNRYEQSCINILSSIANVNTSVTANLEKYKPGKQDNFEDVQDIVASKIALDKKYKLKADLEDPIVRQLQVMMEKLEYKAGDKGFWMQYYVPFFKSAWKDDQFEPMIFHTFSSVDSKKIKEYNQKEKKKVEAFSETFATYLSAIRESNKLVESERSTATERFYIKNYEVYGKGAFARNAKEEIVLSGPWEFYYSGGRVRSRGTFTNDGLRMGEWDYFYENGQLKESTVYKNDIADGSSKVWHDNGNLYSSTTYKDGKKESVESLYYFNGHLSSVINYKADNKDGVAEYYSIDGDVTSVFNYKNDKREGKGTTYYANGNTESEVNYANDKANGVYKEYFDNGKIKDEGNYTDGDKNGMWKSYFKDGKPSKVENYIKGDLDGESISYYTNGKVETKQSYKKGDEDGKNEAYDDDGILFSDGVFEKGRLREIRFYNKKGVLISNTTSRNGKANIVFYDPWGTKESEGFYTKDGLGEGKFMYYFKNGQVSAEANYKDGQLDGKKTWYYPNNKIKEEGNYKAGKANGYFIDYYINGQISNEGWYVDDERQGTFINYDLMGNITSRIYYLNDEIHGISEYFNPGNKRDNNYYYDHGWFDKMEEFDSTGKIVTTSKLNKGEGVVTFNHFNGNVFLESHYKYYKLNGAYTVTNGNGSKKISAYYKNGNHDSTYIAWFPNGKVEVEGHYKNGDKNGSWKYYYYNGVLSAVENYKDDEIQGKATSYNESGVRDREYSYKDGELDGEVTYYGDNNLVMLVLYYKAGSVLGYSYEDKAGKLLPMIPLENESGILDSYYKNGIKSAHMVFKESVLDGERSLYYSNGKLQLTATELNNLTIGLEKIYYPSGKIMKEENYYYGTPHGSYKHYNEDGSLISDINYYLGNLNGDCKYYTAGKPVQTYFYYYGVLESTK